MKIDITTFDGIRPRVGAHLLDNGMATIARNVRIGSGMLKPLGVMRDLFVNVPQDTKSIYHWQDDWLFYSDARSFAPGPAKSYSEEQEDEDGDALAKERNERRLFISNDDAGGLYVYRKNATYWKLGVPAPTTAPTVETTSNPKSSSTKETRVYVYTYVNSLGQESAPSPASETIDVQGQKVKVSGINGDVAQITADGYCPILFIRIYRLAVGNEDAGYLLVNVKSNDGQGTAVSKNSYTDKISDRDLGEALPSLGWRAPSEELKMITAVGNGSYAAFVDNEVRFSQPLYPYAWPDALSHVLEYEIVGMVRSSVYLYIFTKGSVYYMSVDDVTSSVPVKMEGIYPCLSAQGIVSIPGGAVFPCQDGLYFVGAGYSKPFKISSPYFDEPQWAALWPAQARGAYSNGVLYYFLAQPKWMGSAGLLMKLGVDEGGNATIQNMTSTDAPVDIPYTDDNDGFLYCKSGTSLLRWEGDVNTGEPESKSNMEAAWQSKSFLTGNKVNFSCAIVEQGIEDDPVYEVKESQYEAVQDDLPKMNEPQNYTRVIFFRNGKEFYRREITDREAFVLPAGFTGRTLQLRIETNVWVRRVAVAESMAELFA